MTMTNQQYFIEQYIDTASCKQPLLIKQQISARSVVLWPHHIL